MHLVLVDEEMEGTIVFGCAEELARCLGRSGKDELYTRHLPGDPSGSVEEARQMPRDFLRSRSWHEAHRHAPWVHAELPLRLLAARERREDLHERMPDPGHRDSALAVELFFESEEDKHPVDVTPDPVEAEPSPRPELRADEVEDSASGALGQRGDEWQVEVTEIDEDDGIRPGRREVRGQPLARPSESAYVAARVERSDGRGACEIIQQLDAGGLHLRPTEAGNGQVRIESLQVGDKRGRVMVARGIAGNKANG